VDTLGGVPIHLNQPIKDPHAGYLPVGDLNLDGEQALVLVRSRNMPEGDLDRVKSQRAFLKALLGKAEKMKSVWKVNQLVSILASNCKTDYKAEQLIRLAQELQGFNLEDVQFVTIPGKAQNIDKLSYFVSDKDLILRMTEQINMTNWISSSLMLEIQPKDSYRVEATNPPDADVIGVMSSFNSSEVLQIIVEELTLMGHKQVLQKIAKDIQNETTIYYRSEAKENCQNIVKLVPEFAGARMIQDKEVTVQHNSPIVIVLGKDFTTPSLTAIYGRICQPAFDFDNLGKKVRTFR
jgi:hypothetical protein